jgi:O-antigen ligase
MPAFFAFVLITLPWLNPFSPGPMAQATPLLFAWVCAAGILLALAFDSQQGQNPRMVRAVVLAWAMAAGLSAGIALLQYFGLTARFGVWLNHTEMGQAFGNLRQRNQLATLLNIGFAAALWLAAKPRPKVPARGTNRTQQFAGDGPGQPVTSPLFKLSLALVLALTACVSAANVASSSRTGLFQLALVVALSLWWLHCQTSDTGLQKRTIYAVLLTATLTYALATVTLPLLAGLDPLSSGAWARLRAGDAACSSRMTLWSNVLHLIAQRPWAGWGWGELDYAHFITLYPGTRFCDILDNAHNLPLHLAVELGLPVALALCSCAVWLVWREQPWREREPTRQLAWTVLAVILLHSLLEYPLWYGPFQTAAALCIWLLWWSPSHVGSAAVKPNKPIVPYAYTSAALFLIAYCVFASWNYFLASQIYLDTNARAVAYRDNTLEKIKGIWLYRDVVQFAELTTTELNLANAVRMNALAKAMLHFSPEARVAELIVESAQLLGRTDEVAFYSARYQAAFPQAYLLWSTQPAALRQAQ